MAAKMRVATGSAAATVVGATASNAQSAGTSRSQPPHECCARDFRPYDFGGGEVAGKLSLSQFTN